MPRPFRSFTNSVLLVACFLLQLGGITSLRAQSPSSPSAAPRTQIADLLERAGDLSDPETRRQTVVAIRQIQEDRRQVGLARVAQLGLPARLERPDGLVKEVADVDAEGNPVYFITHNLNAAISTGANLLQNSPVPLNGGTLTVGVWDGGAVRSTHQEFDSRISIIDGASPIDHATHVGGTIAASGVVTNARGMAPAARIDSYDWNSDLSEMTARGASAPNQDGKLYLSNHSYGYLAGWYRTGGSQPAYVWYGSGTTENSVDPRFGLYNTQARDTDALAFNAPYYLIFRSAGNDRIDNPANGQIVQLSPGNTTTVSYDSTLHPKGDGIYRGGFETISFDALAKNVITIGSVADAVTGGLRDPAKASMSSFSSWGPTDDGRIKPDLVANGEGVYSSLNGSNTSYGSLSGTSMSGPNATGTAALLIEEYARLFPGSAMRAATLKGLLIHTADDLGQPGPDYKFGWGLLNGVAAATLLRDHASHPLKIRLTEALITSTATTVSHDFVWDGFSPLRATLSWTDPAGTATTTTDLRSPRLRNNLDLKIIDPDNNEHFPYIMPFVGLWSPESMNLPATTGINNTDNLEQVYLAAPPAPGVYRAIVTFQGTLANNQQAYSLLISGSADEEPPPPPLSLATVFPASGLAGASLTLELTGTALATATNVRLTRLGQPDIVATSLSLQSGVLRAQFNLTGASPALWNVAASNSEETAVLPLAFTVIGALWSENFDGTVAGWASSATTGTNAWSLATDLAHSAPRSYFAPAPATKTTTYLISPGVPIPAAATNLQLKFWHRYELQTGQDGGRLELSVEGGAWFSPESTNSGASFASNGYNTTIANTGNPAGRSEFGRRLAWSGNSNGFVETVLNFNDTAKFAGKTVRFRWGLATNGSIASPGWHVDSIALLGGGDLTNQPPSLLSPATTDSSETETDLDGFVTHLVRATSVGVSVSATDDGGEAALTYTWDAVSAPIFFQPNASHAAQSSIAQFEAPGDYALTVTVRDAAGLAVSSSVQVRVLATASGLEVAPAAATVTVGAQQAFAATLLDQFGVALATQPSSFDWSVNGGGSINSTGTFTATTAGGPHAVTASDGTFHAFASVTVNRAAAAVSLSNLLQTFDGQPKSVTVTTDPAGLAVIVTYDGAEASPTAAGDYAVDAIITDPNYQGQATATLVIESRRHLLTLDANPAEAGEVFGTGLYEEGTTVLINALPATGWHFTGWSGDAPADATSASTTITLDAPKTLAATFTFKTGYELWAESHYLSGADADLLADPDGDGWVNLIEYATGTDPLAAGPSVVVFEWIDGVPTFSFPRIADPVLNYAVEFTDDLSAPWSLLVANGNPSTGPDNVEGVVLFIDPVSPQNLPRRFYRLRVSY